MTPNPSTALSALPRTPCSGYVRHYTASRHKEEATTALAWKDGVLVQKWEISETRDIYCDKAKRDYSHTEYHREEVWRAIPVIPIDKQIAESYFYEEDDASASIEIANIDDLLSVIAFYSTRRQAHAGNNGNDAGR